MFCNVKNSDNCFRCLDNNSAPGSQIEDKKMSERAIVLSLVLGLFLLLVIIIVIVLFLFIKRRKFKQRSVWYWWYIFILNSAWFRQMQVEKILNDNPEMQRDFLQSQQGKRQYEIVDYCIFIINIGFLDWSGIYWIANYRIE